MNVSLDTLDAIRYIFTHALRLVLRGHYLVVIEGLYFMPFTAE